MSCLTPPPRLLRDGEGCQAKQESSLSSHLIQQAKKIWFRFSLSFVVHIFFPERRAEGTVPPSAPLTPRELSGQASRVWRAVLSTHKTGGAFAEKRWRGRPTLCRHVSSWSSSCSPARGLPPQRPTHLPSSARTRRAVGTGVLSSSTNGARIMKSHMISLFVASPSKPRCGRTRSHAQAIRLQM